MLHKAWNSKGEMLYCFPRSSITFQGHTVQNITDFDPNWAFPDYRPVAAFKSLRFALLLFHTQRLNCGRNMIESHMNFTASLPSSSIGWMGRNYPDSQVHGAIIGPIWGPMKPAIRVNIVMFIKPFIRWFHITIWHFWFALHRCATQSAYQIN